VTVLEDRLRALRESGRVALVCYVVGGMSDDWLDAVRAAVHAGADAIEIGLPFSDPIMDGPVIQRAADVALARGANFTSIVDDVARLGDDVPLVAMTYFNVLHHRGLARAAGELSAAGISGTIVPDLPLEEVGPWREVANAAGLASVLLVAPSTPSTRVAEVATSSQGFVYAAARMAVTGAANDTGDAERVVSMVRSASDRPVYVGIGISSPEMAAATARLADGVIVGTAIVSRLLDGEGPAGVERFVASLRRAIDERDA
jgi:tryptophan synthase alpha chain